MGRLESEGIEAHAVVPPSMVSAAPVIERLDGRHRWRIDVGDFLGGDQPAVGVHRRQRVARLVLAARR